MKNFLLLCACIIGMYTSVAACDVCGCSSGASYMGTMPLLNRSFVGLRYNWNSYRVSSHNNDNGSLKDNYMTMDFWARYFPHKRIQLMAIVPFTYFTRKGGNTPIATGGLGDVSLMAGYMVINTGDSIGKTWKQTLTVNAGAKLPTGQFNNRAEGLRLSPGMQPGTGTVDWLANIFYTIRYNKVGISLDANARFCGTNRNSYNLGNRYGGAAKFFVWQRLGFRSSILPSVGISADYARQDREFNLPVAESGGHGVYATVGVEFYYQKLGFGVSYQQPVNYAYSNNTSTPKTRFGAQLMYTF